MGRMMFAQGLGSGADLPFAAEEDEDIAAVDAAQLVHRIEYRLLHVAIAAVFVLGQQGAVAHLHRIHAPRYLDDRRGVEMLGETLRIDGGRGDDQFEIGTLGQQLLEIAQQKIDIEAALVGLVDDQGVVVIEVAVVLGFGQQDTVGHHLDVGVGAGVIAETHLVAHRRAERRCEFLGDPRRHGARRDAPRLGVADHPRDAAPQTQADLGQLGGLARTGLAAHDHHLVAGDGRGQFLAARRYRQLFGETGNGECRPTLRAARLGGGDRRTQAPALPLRQPNARVATCAGDGADRVDHAADTRRCPPSGI